MIRSGDTGRLVEAEPLSVAAGIMLVPANMLPVLSMKTRGVVLVRPQ